MLEALPGRCTQGPLCADLVPCHPSEHTPRDSVSSHQPLSPSWLQDFFLPWLAFHPSLLISLPRSERCPSSPEDLSPLLRAAAPEVAASHHQARWISPLNNPQCMWETFGQWYRIFFASKPSAASWHQGATYSSQDLAQGKGISSTHAQLWW